MLLEVAKPLSFLLSILSLYPVALSAFFDPGARWEERLLLALPKVAEAACICFLSGILFAWPARSNPDRDQPLTSTLPVRLFLWAMPGMALLFAISWYIVAASPCYENLGPVCR